MRKAVIMEVRKAEIKDLDIVVQMKMDMFKEVGSVTLLQENNYTQNTKNCTHRKNAVTISYMKTARRLRAAAL